MTSTMCTGNPCSSGAEASPTTFPHDQLIARGLAELAPGAALIDRLQSIRWQTPADVVTRAAHRPSAPPRSTSIRQQPSATSCEPGPTYNAHRD
jgi:hypothetical protein